MPYIGHVLSRDDWRQFEQAGEYRPASLDKQGFIHCSKLGQVGVVADCNFKDELVLLLIDETRVDPPVRYETNERDRPSPFHTSTDRSSCPRSSRRRRSNPTTPATGSPIACSATRSPVGPGSKAGFVASAETFPSACPRHTPGACRGVRVADPQVNERLPAHAEVPGGPVCCGGVGVPPRNRPAGCALPSSVGAANSPSGSLGA